MSTQILMQNTPLNMELTIPRLEISNIKEKNATEKLSAVSTHWWNLMAMSELSTTTRTSGVSTLMSKTPETIFTKNKL